MNGCNKFILLCLFSFLILSCASPEQRKARIDKKNQHFTQLENEIKFYNYDNPKICDISKQCRFVMSYACWADTPEFEQVCKRRFLATSKKYAGDTYLYNTKPRSEGEDLTFVHGEIYKCNSGEYTFPERYAKSFKVKAKYAGFRARFVPSEYNKKCNILSECQPLHGELNCSSSRNNAAIRCYKYLKGHIPKSYPTYLINEEKYTEVKNSRGAVFSPDYDIKGTIYSCPEEKTSALQKYTRKIHKDTLSDFEPEEIPIDRSDIKLYSGTGKISIINTQLSKDVLYLRRRSGFYLDMHGPSGQLAHFVKNELNKLGYTITDEAKKTIKIHIDTIESFSTNWYHERVNIVYKITLGNGKTYLSYREAASPGDLNTALNDSISKVATDILNHKAVQQYLDLKVSAVDSIKE